MRRAHFFITLFLAAALVTLAACGGKKEVKRVPEEATVTKEAFAVIESLRAAYVAKDDTGLRASTTEEGYRALRKEMRDFDTASLQFTPRWVEIRGEVITVNVQWEGSWTMGGKTTKDSGMAVMELSGKPLKVSRVLKGSPFAHP